MIEIGKALVGRAGNIAAGHYPVSIGIQIECGHFPVGAGGFALYAAAEMSVMRHLSRPRRIGEVGITQPAPGGMAGEVDFGSTRGSEHAINEGIELSNRRSLPGQCIPVECKEPVGAVAIGTEAHRLFGIGVARRQKAVNEHHRQQRGIAARFGNGFFAASPGKHRAKNGQYKECGSHSVPAGKVVRHRYRIFPAAINPESSATSSQHPYRLSPLICRP
jgi:hypothetical protein